MEATCAGGSTRGGGVASGSGPRSTPCPVHHASQVLRLNNSAVGALSTGHVVNLVSNDVRRWGGGAGGRLNGEAPGSHAYHPELP